MTAALADRERVGDPERDDAGRFVLGSNAAREPLLLAANAPDVPLWLRPHLEAMERPHWALCRRVLGRGGLVLRPLAREWALSTAWAAALMEQASTTADVVQARQLAREAREWSASARAAFDRLVRLGRRDVHGRPKPASRTDAKASDVGDLLRVAED